MTGLDNILEEAMIHDDHIDVMIDDFECIDGFADTDPENMEDPNHEENIEDEEKEDIDHV